jgi:hypothetical protein
MNNRDIVSIQFVPLPILRFADVNFFQVKLRKRTKYNIKISSSMRSSLKVKGKNVPSKVMKQLALRYMQMPTGDASLFLV